MSMHACIYVRVYVCIYIYMNICRGDDTKKGSISDRGAVLPTPGQGGGSRRGAAQPGPGGRRQLGRHLSAQAPFYERPVPGGGGGHRTPRLRPGPGTAGEEQ